MKDKISNQSGFTMVELLVTMGIVGFMTAGIYTTSILQTKNVQMTNDMGKVQQNVRIATGMVERDLRFAGYGIGNGTVKNSTLGTNVNTAALKIVNGGSGGVKPDRVDMVYLDVSSKLAMTKVPNLTAAVFFVDDTADPVAYAKYNEGDLIIVSDGTHSDMVGITKKNGKNIVHNTGNSLGYQLNLTKDLSWEYQPGDSVFKAYYASYYVETVNGTKCLMIDDNGPATNGTLDGKILVPNIETMDVMAGVDLNGDGQIDSTEWKSGDYETGTHEILAAKLSVSSLSPAIAPHYASDSMNLGDQVLPSGLNQRRRVFSRVVNLRNLAAK